MLFFFMLCPTYDIHRRVFQNVFEEFAIKFDVRTILYGSEFLDYKQNVKLLLTVETFIKKTAKGFMII